MTGSPDPGEYVSIAANQRVKREEEHDDFRALMAMSPGVAVAAHGAAKVLATQVAQERDRWKGAANTAQGEVERMQERERHFAKVLGVADGGQYRADWDARITALVAERDAARAELREMTEHRDGMTELWVQVSNRHEVARADVDTLLAAIATFRRALDDEGGASTDALYAAANTIREGRA